MELTHIIIALIIGGCALYIIWRMFQVLAIIALVGFMAYVAVTHDNNNHTPLPTDDTQAQQMPTNTKPNPTPANPLTAVQKEDTALLKTIEKIVVQDGQTTKIEVHHFYHNAPNQAEKSVPKSDSQLVKNTSPSAQPEQVKEELNYCKNLIIKGKKFVLIDGFYPTEQGALKRVALLNEYNIKGVDVIWLPCYENNTKYTGYAVILGRACNSEGSIERKKAEYNFELFSNDIRLEEPEVFKFNDLKTNVKQTLKKKKEVPVSNFEI